MKDNNSIIPWVLPWGDNNSTYTSHSEGKASHCRNTQNQMQEAKFDMAEVSHLLDQMIMDIQHLELEIVRTRYRLSFYLKPPYDEYLRMDIFSSMGTRYGGDPVYDEYLTYCGLGEYDDAIDTSFHVQRMQRLARGYDDYPDMYP